MIGRTRLSSPPSLVKPEIIGGSAILQQQCHVQNVMNQHPLKDLITLYL